MDSFLIHGGRRLSGKVEISGSKNSALPILAACLMAEGKSTLNGVPRLSDIDSMTRLIGELGCHVYRHEPTVGGRTPWDGPALNGPLDIQVMDERCCEARYDIVKTMRASICVLGPLLAKRGKAIVSIPGGCAIGDRPVDLHVRGLQKLGAEFHTENGNIIGEVRGRLKGKRMYLGGAQGPTVLGTINVMCAACLAEGETVLVGAACEPEVSDCAQLLIKMGAKITGHGTPEVKIEGVEKLVGAEHRIIPDRIECGTFMMAAAITGGSLELKHCNMDHLIAVTDRLDEMGIVTERENGTIRVSCDRRPSPSEMTTQPYPGFPTDLQAQLMSLLALAGGNSVITERIFPDRFLHVGELNRMGARIRKVEGATAVIQGVDELHGTSVMASDLRASAALVLAGLVAKGTTRIDRVYHIDRGYEKIELKLAAVGAQIERVKEARAVA
jgi:UDP-N-acetylglucosamine 1-carboxyvinyltransferase